MDESDLIERALGDPGEAPGALERARAELLDAIRVERERRRPRSRRFLLPAAAAVALVAAVATVVALVGPLGGSTAAAAELHRLATIASSAGRPDVGPGEYFLTVVDELRLETTTPAETSSTPVVAPSSYTVVSQLRLRSWIASDGSSFRVTEVVSSRFASEADRMVWETAGRPHIPQAGDIREESSGTGAALWVDLNRLPKQPAQLLAALRSASIVPRSPGDDQVFLIIGRLLAQGDASPAVRGALLEAAARLEGIEEIGDVADPLDRVGVGLALEHDSSRVQLIFDRATAELLAIEVYDIADGSVDPTSWEAFHPAKVVTTRPDL